MFISQPPTLPITKIYALLILFLKHPAVIYTFYLLSPAADGVPVQKDGEQVSELPITPTYIYEIRQISQQRWYALTLHTTNSCLGGKASCSKMEAKVSKTGRDYLS